MSVTGGVTVLTASAALALGACTSTSDHAGASKAAVSQAPSTSSGAAVPGGEEPVAAPPQPTRVDLRKVPTTVIAPDVSNLRLHGATPVPWTDFLENPENGQPLALNSGTHTMPIQRSAYLRESAVWDTGIIWYADSGLEFMRWDGQQTRIKGGRGWYGQDAFSSGKAYFVRHGDLMSVAEHDLTVRLEADLEDLAGPAAGEGSRVALAGLIADDDPVVRVTSTHDGGRVSHLYSLQRGYVPLPDRWSYTGGSVAVGADSTGKAWSAYDTNTYQPLWSRVFAYGKAPVRLYMIDQIPGGRYVALETEDQRSVYIVAARTGRVVHGLKFGKEYYDREFEDAHHVVFLAHDGPRNPFEDPADPEPAPEQMTWPNVLVRCSVRGRCEKVAQVEPNRHAIHIGDTHLYPHTGGAS